jgi:fructose-1,6-bisphosphatase
LQAAVRRVGLLALHGAHGSTNATGDDVKKLDVISNEVFINQLKVRVRGRGVAYGSRERGLKGTGQ